MNVIEATHIWLLIETSFTSLTRRIAEFESKSKKFQLSTPINFFLEKLNIDLFFHKRIFSWLQIFSELLSVDIIWISRGINLIHLLWMKESEHIMSFQYYCLLYVSINLHQTTIILLIKSLVFSYIRYWLKDCVLDIILSRLGKYDVFREYLISR